MTTIVSMWLRQQCWDRTMTSTVGNKDVTDYVTYLVSDYE